MEELTLVIRFIIGMIFLSTAYFKFNNFEEHIYLIKQYNILPNSLLKIFGKIEVILEFIVGMFLLLGVFQRHVSLVAALLLLIYSIAISLNILRDKKDISCGCGGLLGQDKLSWSLIFRNLIIMGGCVQLIFSKNIVGSLEMVLGGQTIQEVYGANFFISGFFSFILILIGTSFVNLLNIQKKIKKLFDND